MCERSVPGWCRLSEAKQMAPQAPFAAESRRGPGTEHAHSVDSDHSLGISSNHLVWTDSARAWSCWIASRDAG